MYKKVGDYASVYDLIRNDDDDEGKCDAFRNMAETHYEMMEW